MCRYTRDIRRHRKPPEWIGQAFVFFAVASAACGDVDVHETSTHAIRGGHPIVDDGAVLAMARGGEVFCSAVMIGPSHALTAAHCLEEPHNQLRLRTAGEPGAGAALASARLHPRYALGADNDIAVISLTAPQGMPVALGSEAPGPGALVHITGFGKESPAGGAGQLRSGTARVRDRGANTLELEPDSAKPCFGDSGGAVFRDGPMGRELVGLIVEGDEVCEAVSRAIRIDVHRDGFITPALEGMRAEKARQGQRCSADLDCEVGYCLRDGRDTNEGFCSNACFPSDERACVSGFVCRGSAPGSPGLFECVAVEKAPPGCSLSGGRVSQSGGPVGWAFCLCGLFVWRCRRRWAQQRRGFPN